MRFKFLNKNWFELYLMQTTSHTVDQNHKTQTCLIQRLKLSIVDSLFFPETQLSPGYMSGHEPESLSPYDQQVYHLEKQLDIECKVKQGADQVNFLTLLRGKLLNVKCLIHNNCLYLVSWNLLELATTFQVAFLYYPLTNLN